MALYVLHIVVMGQQLANSKREGPVQQNKPKKHKLFLRGPGCSAVFFAIFKKGRTSLMGNFFFFFFLFFLPAWSSSYSIPVLRQMIKEEAF